VLEPIGFATDFFLVLFIILLGGLRKRKTND